MISYTYSNDGTIVREKDERKFNDFIQYIQKYAVRCKLNTREIRGHEKNVYKNCLCIFFM